MQVQDKLNKTKAKNPELYTTEPRKTNKLEFLKTEPYKRANFHYWNNPEIKQGPHVTEASRSKPGNKRANSK
jgi:hypothetical protein